MKHDCTAAARYVVFGLLLSSVTFLAFAHHSKSMYDLDKTITLECTVTEVDWGNPHVLFLADAKQVDSGKGSVTNWNLEGPSPNSLESKGLKSDTLKVGDKITVTGNPRKDGRPDLLLVGLTDASGRHYIVVEPQ